MAHLSGDLSAVESQLHALRVQAGAMEYAIEPASPARNSFAAPRSPRSPLAAGLDPTAPDFLSRLADLKAQHARNLRELELQLQRGSGVLTPRPGTGRPPVRPQSARRPSSASPAARAAELDELLADVRARRGVDTSRLDSAREQYHARPQSAPHQRPARPRSTVPRPFDFESRDEARRKAHADEMARLRRRRSEGEQHFRPFKAQPVPLSTIEPRYEQMVQRADHRRKQIVAERRDNLEKNGKPFSFQTRPPVPRNDELQLEHKFTAKPVPEFVSMRVYENMQNDEAQRKERVSRAAAEKLARASLPPRMELYAQMGKVNKVTAHKELSGDGSGEVAQDFKPRINPMSPAIPPFAHLQAKFEHVRAARRRRAARDARGACARQRCPRIPARQCPACPAAAPPVRAQALAKKKHSVPPTAAQPFSMYTDRRPNRMERVLRDIERDALLLPEQRWPHASTRAPVKYEPITDMTPPESAYRTTLAAELRRASLEDEHELRSAIRRQQQEEDQRRLAKQQQIDKDVAAVRASTGAESSTPHPTCAAGALRVPSVHVRASARASRARPLVCSLRSAAPPLRIAPLRSICLAARRCSSPPLSRTTPRTRSGAASLCRTCASARTTGSASSRRSRPTSASGPTSSSRHPARLSSTAHGTSASSSSRRRCAKTGSAISSTAEFEVLLIID
jgi:hypothetical protein